ncbi:hypothetical protein SAMN05518672_1017 [Chitinophaga sp. CF118]|nr:hypothetical protein SAMN05518672_1017 [Chitinophaga sp. CF118]
MGTPPVGAPKPIMTSALVSAINTAVSTLTSSADVYVKS